MKEEPRERLKVYLHVLTLLEQHWDPNSFHFFELGLNDRENQQKLLNETRKRKSLPPELQQYL